DRVEVLRLGRRVARLTAADTSVEELVSAMTGGIDTENGTTPDPRSNPNGSGPAEADAKTGTDERTAPDGRTGADESTGSDEESGEGGWRRWGAGRSRTGRRGRGAVVVGYA